MEENKSSVGNTKKRSKSDEDEAADSPPVAKKEKRSATDINIINPLTPTQDPCDKSYDLVANASHKKNSGKNVMWVIYLASRETSDSSFAQCIQKCRSIAAASSGDGQLASRLQMDGTRHVTLWEGKMTRQEASKICFEEEDDVELPVAVRFSGWIPRGGYLQLDSQSQANLKYLVSYLEHLPTSGRGSGSKTICDHLSLYRCRGMNWQTFNQECAKIRNGVPAKEWGMVEGVSVRLKVMGSDYSHCRVLAGV